LTAVLRTFAQRPVRVHGGPVRCVVIHDLSFW
jgi:hypothetical protein